MSAPAPKLCGRCGSPDVVARPGPHRCASCISIPRVRVRQRRKTREGTPARTLSPKQLRREVWRENQLTSRTTVEELLAANPRPTLRSECEPCPVCQAYIASPTASAVLACGHRVSQALNHCRPCVRVGCTENLYLDVNPETGSIKFNYPDLEPWELEHSCALDVADEGPHILEDVAAAANVTRERLRQIERGALTELARVARRLR